MKKIYLKEAREKSLKNKHPWIFKSAVKPAKGEAGEIVQVCTSAGKAVALAFYNPHSQISLRLFSWDPEGKADRTFWEDRIVRAVGKRDFLLADPTMTDSCRLIFGEADELPGLVVDRYNEYLSVQFLTAGMELLREEILSLLDRVVKPKGILEKSDTDMRKLEGLGPSEGLLRGREMPPAYAIRENGIRFFVDLTAGQKTGFYLDQRDNRRKTARWAKGLDVLDAFCYSGGFSLNAWKEGARSVTAVDSSDTALEALRDNMTLNGIEKDAFTVVEDNAFEFLRREIREGRTYDMIILDPPKLAPTKAHVEKAMRAYKDLNLQGLKLVKKGGILATFSCSGGLSLQDLKMICAWSALDAHRNVTVLEVLSQPPDHPVSLRYPESEYLKGLILRVE